MQLLINVSKYDLEYIRNMYDIPKDISVSIAEALLNGREIPPHGRLGDLDALWDKMSNYIDNEGAVMPFGDDDTIIHRDSACFIIEQAPTIIETEE